MEPRKVCIGTVTKGGMTWQGVVYSLLLRHTRSSLACLGILSALIADGRCVAQTTAAGITPPPGRLSVRPHAMATGTRTVQAGEQPLDSLRKYLVYVPKQCVGTRRVPLVVWLHGAAEDSRDVMDEWWQRQFADKYGMILLVPNSTEGLNWDVIHGMPGNDWQSEGKMVRIGHDAWDQWKVLKFRDPDVRKIDAALQQVLRKFAIDPDKIALAGMSAGGGYSDFLGAINPDVFSRVAVISGGIATANRGPRHTTTQFFISAGLGEETAFGGALFTGQYLRRDGYAVQQVLAPRGHWDDSVEYDAVWRWFQSSWARPRLAARATQHAVTGSMPVLTDEALTRMITFWTRLMREPDSLWQDSREAHQGQLTVLVGSQPVWFIDMVDIPALAARYPSVAADLQQAGLTTRKEEEYRAALLSAGATMRADSAGGAGTVKATSVLGNNVAFLRAHLAAFEALKKTPMWVNAWYKKEND